MYIDERLLKILETHKGETVDVNFMISLIKTIAKEHVTEQLRIADVSSSTDLNHKYSIGELNLFLFFFVRWENIKIKL